MDTSALKDIEPLITGIIIPFLVWLIKEIRKTLNLVRKNAHELEEIKHSIAGINAKDIQDMSEKMKKALDVFSAQMKEMMAMKEDVILLKNSIKTMWDKHDIILLKYEEFDRQINMLRKRTHFFANKVMILRGKMEKMGATFSSLEDDWKMPE